MLGDAFVYLEGANLIEGRELQNWRIVGHVTDIWEVGKVQ
jgi:hypothetical protein